MKFHIDRIRLSTKGELDMVDITPEVTKIVRESGISAGFAIIFCIGSTCALTTMEYEEGLKKDIKEALQRLFPDNIHYAHNLTWGDFNGHSHVRASFIKPDLIVPIQRGDLVLGRWQQIVFIELDTRKRDREIVVEVVGE